MVPDKTAAYAGMKSLYPFVNTFSAGQERLFRDRMMHRRYRKGHVLAEEGVSCSSIHFILEGSIRVFKISEDGREITLYRINKGDLCLITASCILSAAGFPAIARVETETEVVSLPAETFKELVEKSPQMQSFMFSNSLNRLKDVVDVVENVTFTDMKQRLARFLVSQAQQHSTHTLRITHEEMASEIGTAREVISRTLKKLEDENVVRLSRGRVQILSITTLKKLCQCD